MKLRLILTLASFLLLCCQSRTDNFNNKVQVARIDSENKLLIGTVTEGYSGAFEYDPSMHLYHCFYDNSAGLIISFGWGEGFGGESCKIVSKNGQFKISLDSGGCGLFDSFDFINQHQTLVLSDTTFANTDTISGYIEYKGIQDTEGMKQRFKKYESGIKTYYGVELSYFDTLIPKTVSIMGSFNLLKCNHVDSSDLDNHKWILMDANTRKQLLTSNIGQLDQ